jgi:hypothetical protein
VNPNGIIQNIFLYIAVPLVGIVVLVALAAGRVKVMGTALLALVVAAMFVYMPAGVLNQLGSGAAHGLATFLNR